MSVGVVDVRLIDPTEAELAAALRRAHAAANRGVRVGDTHLDRDTDFWTRFARDCRRGREGRRRSCRAGYQTPEVVAGWWTDPASRKHFRVLGRTRVRVLARMRPEGELRGLPPWWHVYPESVLAVRRPDGGSTYLACCRCGAVGTPESLGWMGDSCGPCFDRRADGGVAAGGFGQFSGWGGGIHVRVAFSHDGAFLAGPKLPDRLRAIRLADGAETQARGIREPTVGVVAVPGAYLFGGTDGAVYRWDPGQPAAGRVLPRAPLYGRPLLDPTGRRAVVLSMNTGFVADLAAETPRYAQVPLTRHYTALRFADSGRAIYGASTDGALVAIDPATLSERVVRDGLFAGQAHYGYATDVAVSPDESTAAVLRYVYSPSGVLVRVVPVGAGAAPPQFRLPEWHRPTSLAFAPDGGHLATLETGTGWVGFWRLPQGKPVGFVRAVPEDPGWQGGQVLFSPAGAVAVLYAGFHQERGSTVAVWPWPAVAEAAGSP
jgi:hypothetical protein